jgi:hypothetical protein
MTNWRQRMGEEQLQALLQESLAVATRSGAIKPADLARVIVDTTVQPKNVTFPTDVRRGKSQEVKAMVPLILLNVGTERRPYRYGMTDAAPSEDRFCAVCDGPMRLLTTIRSAFAEDRRVFQCKPCGLSTTETAKQKPEGPIR